MKRILCIILSILMLLSLAACGEPEPDPEQLAFEAACALLEEGKYQEAIAAFSRLESYRKVQEKIDEAEAALEAQWLASEEAARQAELEKLGFLYGTTWHELGGTAELTFEEHQNGGSPLHCRHWEDRETLEDFDAHWKFIDGEIWISYFPGLDPDTSGEYGYRATAEERDGVTHLLVGDLDFVRSEDYGPFAPVEIEITLDNWQEYFEFIGGKKWEYDDFGIATGVWFATAIVLKEEYRDRLVLAHTDIAFGYTYDTLTRNIAKLDFAALIAEPGGVRYINDKDYYDTCTFSASSSSIRTDNTAIPEFPEVYCLLISTLCWEGENSIYVCEDFTIARVAGTLVLRAE